METPKFEAGGMPELKVGDEVEVYRTSKGVYEGGWTIGAILEDGHVILHKTGDRNIVRNSEPKNLRRSLKVE